MLLVSWAFQSVRQNQLTINITIEPAEPFSSEDEAVLPPHQEEDAMSGSGYWSDSSGSSSFAGLMGPPSQNTANSGSNNEESDNEAVSSVDLEDEVDEENSFGTKLDYERMLHTLQEEGTKASLALFTQENVYLDLPVIDLDEYKYHPQTNEHSSFQVNDETYLDYFLAYSNYPVLLVLHAKLTSEYPR